MAFYIVKFDGATYANQSLMQAALRKGAATILSDISAGTLKARSLFGTTLIRVERQHEDKLVPLVESTEVQDLEKTVDKFVHVPRAETGVKRIVVSNKRGAGILKARGFEFIKLSDVPDPMKYHWKGRMPLFPICGTLFVALDAKVETEKSPVVVTVM